MINSKLRSTFLFIKDKINDKQLLKIIKTLSHERSKNVFIQKTISFSKYNDLKIKNVLQYLYLYMFRNKLNLWYIFDN